MRRGGDFWRKKYLNIGITKATMTQVDGIVRDPIVPWGQPIVSDLVQRSNVGYSLAVGHTFYLHKPLAGMFRFGIDATWFDITYRNYSVLDYNILDELGDYLDDDDYDGGSGMTTCKLHEVSIGMQVGPSLTINPYKKLMAEVYFRYCPSLAIQGGTGENMDMGCGYGSYFVTGCQVTWHCIGLGIEGRFGSSKMKNFFADDDEEEEEYYDYYPSNSRFKTKTKGWRLFLSFRL